MCFENPFPGGVTQAVSVVSLLTNVCVDADAVMDHRARLGAEAVGFSPVTG